MSGCASEPKLAPIPNGETVSIEVAMSPTADGQHGLKNDAIGKDVGVGAGGGAVGGGLLGLFCGPWAPLCIPTFSAFGAAGGAVTGVVVGAASGLSAEQATQLNDRMLRLNESHDKLAELTTNINDQAAGYWDLNSTEPQTTVRVWVQDLIFASTHGDQVRAILQVNVMLVRNSVKPLKNGEAPSMKHYVSASPYASLDSWLDDESDIADTNISGAIQEISNQILSDLAISFSPDGTLQTAKVQLQSTPTAFEFYGEAEDEINTGNYDKNLWAKALVAVKGDETKRKAKYIELRADQLYSAKVGSVSDTSLQQQATPIKQSIQIDLSGKYISEITASGNASNTKRFLEKENHKNITLKQTGNKIAGSGASRNFEINGIREGNTIKFYIVRDNEIEGTWETNADATNLVGKWYTNGGGGASGIWNLTRIE
jgi:hypothetical protein